MLKPLASALKDLTRCRNKRVYRSNLAIIKSIQPAKISNFCVPHISKTIKARNLEQSQKVQHICRA